MPKFFVVSDIHSYYDEMIKALDDAGFDENDEEHWLIGCGDYFDRGSKPLETMKYLHNLPRKILIRGNHEDLLEELCDRCWYYEHDISNGTVGTVTKLGRLDKYNDFDEACIGTKNRVKPFLGQMVNYFETKNYIFVHSWIPLISNDDRIYYYIRDRKFEFNPNWRETTDEEWAQARWGNPFMFAEQRLLPDKTIIFGHWHCSTGWAKNENLSEFGNDAKFEPFFGDGFIAIDACTAHSDKVNILVIEDEFLEG